MRVEGHLKLLGEGVVRGTWSKRSVVEVGNTTISNLTVPARLGSYLNVGEDVALGIWTYLWIKILVVVAADDGRVHKHGAGRLLLATLLFGGLTLFALGSELTRYVPPIAWIGILFVLFVDVQLINGWRTYLSFAPLASPRS